MASQQQSSQQSDSSDRENASASSREDDVLVEQAASGDEQAYKQIVDKYERALYYHILKIVHNREVVEDLVQEAFVKAFDNLGSYSTSYAFSTWLYRIATNHTIDYLRKKKLKTLSIDEPVKTREGEMQMELEDTDSHTDRQVIRKQRQKIIRKAIPALPPKYKRVIQMRHMEEKSYQEISEILDLPLGTVKAHIFRARELLYKALKDKRHTF